MKYVSLDSDEKIFSFISSLNPSSPIAVDLEGEFNLHIYGEHLCLIQIFDGKDFYIIDPRSKAVSEKAVVAFFTCDIQKVWFDVQSDNSLIFKVYGITINNVFDVRALAKALGFMGNLISLEEEFLKLNKDSVDKKKLQQTNWLKRPLTDEQIEYALSDVEYLLELKRVLLIAVEEKGVNKEAEFLLHSACKKPKISPPWSKLCSPRELNKEQRNALKEYFIARDVVAKRFNVPAYMVLDKHKIVELAKKCPRSLDEVYSIVGPISPRFKSYLNDSLKKAFERAYLR